MDISLKKMFGSIITRLKTAKGFQRLDPREQFWEWMTEVALELINNDKELVEELKKVRNEVCKGEDRTLGMVLVSGNKYDYKPVGINKGFHINRDGTVDLISERDKFTVKLYANEDIFWDFIESKNRPETAFWTNQKDCWAEGKDIFRDYYVFLPILKAWGHLYDVIRELLKEDLK